MAITSTLYTCLHKRTASRTPNRRLQEAHNDSSSSNVVGQIVAWVSTCLYLTAKLPQIHRNYARKSTEGLSAKVCTSVWLETEAASLYVLAAFLRLSLNFSAEKERSLRQRKKMRLVCALIMHIAMCSSAFFVLSLFSKKQTPPSIERLLVAQNAQKQKCQN